MGLKSVYLLTIENDELTAVKCLGNRIEKRGLELVIIKVNKGKTRNFPTWIAIDPETGCKLPEVVYLKPPRGDEIDDAFVQLVRVRTMHRIKLCGKSYTHKELKELFQKKIKEVRDE